ncbi:MAG: putative selenocysteine lyase [Rhodoferax sp.]|nr:putative selenocysteine lyase [Rhodoferax sp.]
MSALSAYDWRDLRERTPAAAAYLHFNHASASLPDASVFRAQRDFLDLEASIGTHRAAQQMADELAAVHAVVGRLVNVEGWQVALTHSASHGWAGALSALAVRGPVQVFLSCNEWAANLMNMAWHPGLVRTMLQSPVDGSWAEVVAAALAHRDPRLTPLVSLPLLSSHSGVVHDLAGVAQVVRQAGGWLFVDASQAVGQIDVDATALGADVLVFPARKWLRGPRGIGVAAYSARALAELGAPYPMDIHGTRLTPTQDGLGTMHAPAANRFQGYEHHPSLRLGLKAAATVLLEAGKLRVQDRISTLATRLRGGLAQLEGVRLLDAGGAGLVCICIEGAKHEDVVQRLWDAGASAAVVTSRYAPLALANHQSVVRFSPHVVTQESEVDGLVDLVAKTVRMLRSLKPLPLS